MTPQGSTYRRGNSVQSNGAGSQNGADEAALRFSPTGSSAR